MKKIVVAFLLTLTVGATYAKVAQRRATQSKFDYAVVARSELRDDLSWQKVVETLTTLHSARVVWYSTDPAEALATLREITPRYVAFVDRAENIGREYVLMVNRMSRMVDDDIYADFRWGIITGTSAADALKLVENGTQQKVLRTLLSTSGGISTAHFDRYASISDGQKGAYSENISGTQNSGIDSTGNLTPRFFQYFRELDPDMIVTSSHATEYNLEMPFSQGMIVPEMGNFVAKKRNGEKIAALDLSSHNIRAYFPAGNCLIGNMNNSGTSMAAVWLSRANLGAMFGYTVPTWYGRSGWGALSVWCNEPGRFSLNEAFFLNQQSMLYQLQSWNPKLLSLNFPIDGINRQSSNFDELFEMGIQMMQEAMGGSPFSQEHLGVWYDRDVMAYYGDPKWDMRLKSGNAPYQVTCTSKGRRWIVTVTTSAQYTAPQPNAQKPELKITPIPVLFPERIEGVRVLHGPECEVALDENFMLIYATDFKPSKSYVFTLGVR